MIVALRVDIDIPIDRYYSRQLLVRDKTTKVAIDLSSYTFSSEIRLSPDRNSTLVETFTIDATEKASGIIYQTITAAELDEVTDRQAWYDLVFTNGSSQSETWMWGKVNFVNFPTQVTT